MDDCAERLLEDPPALESRFDQVIAIPHMLIADEAEEMIDDAPAGCGELDLVGVSHAEMLADRRDRVADV